MAIDDFIVRPLLSPVSLVEVVKLHQERALLRGLDEFGPEWSHDVLQAPHGRLLLVGQVI